MTLVTGVLLVLSLAGCDDSSSGGDGDVPTEDVTQLQDCNGASCQSDDGEVFVAPPDPDCISSTDPGGDADDDGIPNAFEDINSNCVLDDGETAHDSSDTDEDGLGDFEEVNSPNGMFDPRNPDSDGDGILDGDEVTAIACGPDRALSVEATADAGSQSNIALPPSFTATRESGLSAIVFGDAAQNAFGFLVATTPGTGDLASDNPENFLNATQTSGNTGSVLLGGVPVAVPSPDWSNDPDDRFDPNLLGVPPFEIARLKLRFGYGPGSGNDGVAEKDPATLRDELVGVLGGDESFSAGVAGTACESIDGEWVGILRGGGQTLVTGAIFTCQDNLSESVDLARTFSDFRGGTIIAPNTHRPETVHCDVIPPDAGPGVADIVWVIDNSGSMADEQANVARTASNFLATLQSSGVDWRLGVSTTEVYFEGTDDESALDDDELLDRPSGLRGAGFLDGTMDDAAALFEQYVTEDEGCVRDEGDEGDNICGDGREDGIRAGAYVVRQTIDEDREAYRLRADDGVVRVVIFVSDEENQGTRATVTGDPEPPGSETYENYLDTYLPTYQEERIRAYAIVGDRGTSAGGICEPFGQDLINGAQWGRSYIELAEQTKGASGSICNTDLQSTINEIIEDIIAIASEYKLEGYPVAPSIRVVVGESELGEDQWRYDENENKIVFTDLSGVTLTAESEIVVGYLLWTPTDG